MITHLDAVTITVMLALVDMVSRGGESILHVVWPFLSQSVEQQHAKHTKTSGVWGHAPSEKLQPLRLLLVASETSLISFM